MPRDFSRASRVSELVRRELADVLATRVGDPRVNLVTVTDVEVSKDLKHAKVFVTRLGGEDDLLETLHHAAPFLRRELGARLRMKSTPSLKFSYDHSVERGVALTKLIEKANQDPGGRQS